MPMKGRLHPRPSPTVMAGPVPATHDPRRRPTRQRRIGAGPVHGFAAPDIRVLGRRDRPGDDGGGGEAAGFRGVPIPRLWKGWGPRFRGDARWGWRMRWNGGTRCRGDPILVALESVGPPLSRGWPERAKGGRLGRLPMGEARAHADERSP